MIVNLDFETRSTVDLKKTEVHVYSAHPTTEVICAAYMIDGGPMRLWRKGEKMPEDLQDAVSKGAEFHARNAQFERVIWRDCLSRKGGAWSQYGNPPPLESWHCSMAQAALCGLPLSLGAAALALHLPQVKDNEGHALMLKMSRPRSFAADGTPIWWEDEEKLERLFAYCRNDVLVERAIAMKLPPMPIRERPIYLADQRANDRGMPLDVSLAIASQRCAEAEIHRINSQLEEITDGAVTSIFQVGALTAWVRSQGVETKSIGKRAIEELLLRDQRIPENVARVLQLRADGAKSSVPKFQMMLRYAEGDGRMRGTLQYAGAATGRWAGRGPQPQNFPRGTVERAELAIPLVLSGDYEAIDIIFAPPMEVLSSLLRQHLIASDGHTLIGGDYVSIEPRVLAWSAGEEDLLKAFATGQDVYKLMASKIYGVEIGKVSKSQREMGKKATLGLGYQMGKDTFFRQCQKSNIDVDEEFCGKVVKVYRATNPKIVEMWARLNNAAVATVASGDSFGSGPLRFKKCRDWLELIPPSGRSLYYWEPRIIKTKTPWGSEQSVVEVHRRNNVTHNWEACELYGGLLVENAVQAIARDILADAMLALEAAGFRIVLTVHDEILVEVPLSEAHRLDEFTTFMRTVPEWARGCPIGVETWQGPRYKK